MPTNEQAADPGQVRRDLAALDERIRNLACEQLMQAKEATAAQTEAEILRVELFLLADRVERLEAERAARRRRRLARRVRAARQAAGDGLPELPPPSFVN